MKIYLVIDEQDTDAAWGCNVAVFLNREAAVEHMKRDFNESLERWEFDLSKNSEERHAECDENEATIQDGKDTERWRVEERELSVELAVEVREGLVQNVYANADVSADVYDLDVEADRKEAELNERVKAYGWRNVW